MSTLKPGLGPKVDDKEIARLLRNLVSIESNKGSKSSAGKILNFRGLTDLSFVILSSYLARQH